MKRTPLSFPQCASSFYEVLPAQINSLVLRRATADDVPFLRQLYRETRDEESAVVGWPEVQWLKFCNSQFNLQHMQYTRQFSKAEFLIIMEGPAQVGRLYVDGAGDNVHVIDIALMAARRGAGIGSALLSDIKVRAKSINKPVTLHLLLTNVRARRLYERLGFVATVAPTGMYIGMRWSDRDGVVPSEARELGGHSG